MGEKKDLDFRTLVQKASTTKENGKETMTNEGRKEDHRPNASAC